MNFWVIFAATFLVNTVWFVIGYFIAWLTDEDRKKKKHNNVQEYHAELEDWIRKNKKHNDEKKEDDYAELKDWIDTTLVKDGLLEPKR